MKAQQEIVTVAMAKEYLERALPNRTLNEAAASRYAEDMKAGRWQLNGQGIILDDQGNMIDGQHRCRAIILAQKPVSMLVVRGVPAAAMETIDGGRARKLSDVLKIEGYADTHVLAGAARAAWNYVAGVNYDYTPTKATLLNFVKTHPALVNSTKAVCIGKNLVSVPRAPFAALLALGNHNGNLSTEAEKFVDGIIYGEGLYKGDARLTFRNWLATLRAQHEYTAFSVSKPTFSALARAWNAYASGKELLAIKFPPNPNRSNLPIFGFYNVGWPDVPDLVENLEVQRIANLNKVRNTSQVFKPGRTPRNKGKTQVVQKGAAPPSEVPA